MSRITLHSLFDFNPTRPFPHRCIGSTTQHYIHSCSNFLHFSFPLPGRRNRLEETYFLVLVSVFYYLEIVGYSNLNYPGSHIDPSEDSRSLWIGYRLSTNVSTIPACQSKQNYSSISSVNLLENVRFLIRFQTIELESLTFNFEQAVWLSDSNSGLNRRLLSLGLICLSSICQGRDTSRCSSLNH